MIKCIRCNKEIESVEDIGKIIKKEGVVVYDKDFCFCNSCVMGFNGLDIKNGYLIDWYRLVNIVENRKNDKLIMSGALDKKAQDGQSVGNDNNSVSGVVFDEEYENNCELAENKRGLYDLEDRGAFLDEGIMSGCHSQYNQERMEAEDYINYLNEQRNCMKRLCAAYNLSFEDISDKTGIPVNLIKDVVNDEFQYHGVSIKEVMAVPVTPVGKDVVGKKTKAFEDMEESELLSELQFFFKHMSTEDGMCAPFNSFVKQTDNNGLPF